MPEQVEDTNYGKTERREKFNTYRFADYKEKVVDLLMRVTRVSEETVAITKAMRRVER